MLNVYRDVLRGLNKANEARNGVFEACLKSVRRNHSGKTGAPPAFGALRLVDNTERLFES